MELGLWVCILYFCSVKKRLKFYMNSYVLLQIACIVLIFPFCHFFAFSMEFKYKEFLDKISDCPMSDCVEKDRSVFRIVHEDISHPNNFLPTLLIAPGRKETVPRYREGGKPLCKGYALSMFNSLDKTKKKYNSLAEVMGNIEAELGTHIAEGQVLQSDGVVGKKGGDGHMNFFEYKNADLASKFTIVQDMRTRS